MHPVISIGIHFILQTVIILITFNCLDQTRLLRDRNGKIRFFVWQVLLLYIFLLLLPVGGTLARPAYIKYTLQKWGNIFFGFFFYFGGTLLLGWLIIQALSPLLKEKKEAAKRAVLCLSIAAGAGLLIYGMKHARDTVRIDYDITIPKETDGIDELRLVLIGDLHLSVNTSYDHIARVVQMINDADPDAVLIAGDIFTSNYLGLKDPDRYSALFRTIKSKYGVFAVYGNHDVEEDLFGGFPVSPISRAFRTRPMEQFMEDSHFTVLYDETAVIADGSVQIVGRVDGEKAGDGTANRKSPAEVLEGTDLSRPVIVLQHEPVEFGALKEAGADLALCGHTHAGQIFPGNLLTPFFNENAFGYKNVKGLDTIVTAGVGFYGPPMRVGTNSDISVVHVHLGL